MYSRLSIFHRTVGFRVLRRRTSLELNDNGFAVLGDFVDNPRLGAAKVEDLNQTVVGDHDVARL